MRLWVGGLSGRAGVCMGGRVIIPMNANVTLSVAAAETCQIATQVVIPG